MRPSCARLVDQPRVRCYVPAKIPKITKKFVAGRQARQVVLAASHGVGRVLALLSVLVPALLTAAAVPAAGPSDDYAEQSLETLLTRTNLHPRAFVEGHKMRLYYTN